MKAHVFPASTNQNAEFTHALELPMFSLLLGTTDCGSAEFGSGPKISGTTISKLAEQVFCTLLWHRN
jgi:hypothetical protein